MRSRLTIGLLLGTVMAGAQTQPWQLDTELTWHDNVTNGEREIDRLPALEWQTELQTGIMRVLPDGHRLSMSAGIRLALWARYEGLNLVAPEIAGAWEYKPGFGPHRPLFRAEIEGEGVMANESDRGGWGGAAKHSPHVCIEMAQWDTEFERSIDLSFELDFYFVCLGVHCNLGNAVP